MALVTPLVVAFMFATPAASAQEGGYGQGGAPSTPGYDQYTPGSSQYGFEGLDEQQYTCDQYSPCNRGPDAPAAGAHVIRDATGDVHGASGDLDSSMSQAGSVGPASDTGDAKYTSADATGDTVEDAAGGLEDPSGAAGGGSGGATPLGESGPSHEAAEKPPAEDKLALSEEVGDASREKVTPVAEVDPPSIINNSPSEEDGAGTFLGRLPVSGMAASTGAFAVIVALLLAARIFRYR